MPQSLYRRMHSWRTTHYLYSLSYNFLSRASYHATHARTHHGMSRPTSYGRSDTTIVTDGRGSERASDTVRAVTQYKPNQHA